MLVAEKTPESTAGPTAAGSPRRDRRSREELRQDTSLVRLLRGAVTASADEVGWSRASAIGQHISNQSSFDARNFGYERLTELLRATDLFDSRDDGTSSVAFRDKRTAKRDQT